MQQFNFNPGQNPNVFQRQGVVTDTVRKSILEAYSWMFAGLIVTGLTAFFTAKSGLLEFFLNEMPLLFFGIIIGQLGLTIAFTVLRNKVSSGVLKGLFLVFALTMGVTLSTIFTLPSARNFGGGYSDTTILTALMISAVYFGCLVFIGMTTKKDMSKIGVICFTGLIAMIITQLILFFFGVSFSTRLISIIGLLDFTGLTAWDVQRLNQTMLMCEGQPVEQQKWAIYFALTLYLDFINIFLKILQLLGSGSRSSK